MRKYLLIIIVSILIITVVVFKNYILPAKTNKILVQPAIDNNGGSNTPTSNTNTVQTNKTIPEFQKITMDDLIKNPSMYLSKKIEVIGKLTLEGNYYQNPNFFITENNQNFPISAWLPLELPPMPPETLNTPKPPSTMQYYINKDVTLRGTVQFREYDKQYYILVTSGK